MNPLFRFIDWMLREHGAFVSGLFVYVACPARCLAFGAMGAAEKDETQPYFHIGYTTANGVVESSTRHSVGN